VTLVTVEIGEGVVYCLFQGNRPRTNFKNAPTITLF